MKVFLSKKDNDTKFELIQEQDGKCEVRFLNGSKKGETTTYTSGTIKRWWKEVEEVEEPTKERHLDPMPEIEKLEDLKKEYSRKSSSKKIDRTEAVKKIVEMLIDDYVYKYYDSVNCYKVYDIMTENHVIAEIYPQRKKIVCYLHSLEGIDLSKTILHKQGYKYYLPCRVDISYDDDFISILREFLRED